jgi:hypothetical protein
MGSILGDAGARFDDGRGSLHRNNNSGRHQQQQTQQQNPAPVQRPQGAYQPNFQPTFNTAADNKQLNSTSNVFDYSGMQQKVPVATRAPAPAPAPQGNYSRQVAHSQRESDIFNRGNDQNAPQHNQRSQQSNYNQGYQSNQQGYRQQQQPQQQPQQQQQGPHTSVRVRAPPGGHSSFSLG